MLLRTSLVIVAMSLPAAAFAAPGVCVTNGSEEAAFFVADPNDAPQIARMLEPGKTLCSGAGAAPGGVVRVFEQADALEGCARLVAEGQTETLLRYSDFDRCLWTSNAN